MRARTDLRRRVAEQQRVATPAAVTERGGCAPLHLVRVRAVGLGLGYRVRVRVRGRGRGRSRSRSRVRIRRPAAP